MTASIVPFPNPPRAADNPESASQFHCAQQVVEHCLLSIKLGSSDELVQRFVETMNKAGYAIVPYWLLNTVVDDPEDTAS